MTDEEYDLIGNDFGRPGYTNYGKNNIPVTSDIPRRVRLDLSLPAELAIRNAVDEVEKLRADVRLTEAVILLDKARNLVADYIDEQLAKTK
jgi:hypothetical protein